MKYDDDKPTTCDYFADVQVGDKIAVNLVDGSRIVGKVTDTTVKYVHVRSSAMTGRASFYRRDSNIESVEVLKRNIVPGLYVTPALKHSVLHYDGERWVQIGIPSGVTNPAFDPEIYNDLVKIELPEYMKL